MHPRPHWEGRIASAWRQASIVWLTGVRRVGKTVLARSVPNAAYLNCDLPSTAQRLADPERFFAEAGVGPVVLDEVHQVSDPSRLLKIAADEFPSLRVLATGSSTLAATRKFRDSLTGRKRVVELVPVLWEEQATFGIGDAGKRLLRGGLPPALLAPDHQPELYAEWLDSYFARDVQELFRLQKRAQFLKLVELVLRSSGGLLDVNAMAKHVGISRPTVMSWLDVLQRTHVAHTLRPFSGGGRREIIAQPKLYGFDTGFVCHARGITALRPGDHGDLWEHLVLDTLLSIPVAKLHYWRDKQQREIDFVLPRGRSSVDTIECKWSADAFDARSLAAFRGLYPQGRDLVVAADVRHPYERGIAGRTVEFRSLESLREELSGPGRG